MPEPDCFSDIVYALLPEILRRENSGAPLQRATVFKMVFIYVPSRRNTFVGGKCALPSTLLVSLMYYSTSGLEKNNNKIFFNCPVSSFWWEIHSRPFVHCTKIFIPSAG